MKKLLGFAAGLVLLTSCTQKTELQTVSYQNKYSIEIPNYLTKSFNLNDEATLQYQNLFKDEYVIIIEEPKSEFDDAIEILGTTKGLEGYHQILVQNLETAIENMEITAVENIKINSFSAKIFSVTGNVENYNVFYKYGIIEGSKSYFQILCWTSKDKQLKSEPWMTQAIKSFKELEKRKKRKL
jgi:hypothetical protein